MAMSHRTDELFSVERLREFWKDRPSKPSVTPKAELQKAQEQQETTSLSATALLAEVARLLRMRFPDAKGKAFEPLLAELEEKVRLRFAAPAGDAIAEEEREALNCDIDGLLGRIENLAEAFDSTQPRKKPGK